MEIMKSLIEACFYIVGAGFAAGFVLILCLIGDHILYNVFPKYQLQLKEEFAMPMIISSTVTWSIAILIDLLY